MRKLVALVLAVVTACTPAAESEEDITTEPASQGTSTTQPTSTTRPTSDGYSPPSYPPAPLVPEGPLNQTTETGLRALLDSIFIGEFAGVHLEQVIEGGDARAGWIIADLLRFFQIGNPRDQLVAAFVELTETEWSPDQVDFVWAFNNLIAWDLPAWDGYPEMKGRIYSRIDPIWAAFFEEDERVDWRFVTWGGVLADTRPMGDNGPCNCIPSLDDPGTSDAAGGDWYEDDRIVFGLVVDGEALALPKHQMEVHEMVNITLGGRDLGIPYCTLCGSAQAYFTDDVPDFGRIVLRTSGLLSRSNKVMYDLGTGSMLDTFTGRALTGSLAQENVTLEQVSVVASTWGEWKRAHPQTRILAEDGGIDRVYSDDPLRGRDDSGPIFPVGAVDPRLPVQEDVVGVVTPAGVPIAFPVNAVKSAYRAGDQFTFEGVTVRLDDGIRVYENGQNELPTHQAFWFAWSQFHPGTIVWSAVGPGG